jgi:3-mercaptopyruvate sulfurtransferase SseA
MGFQNVSILEGGTTAWKNAGLPIEQPGAGR